MRHPILSGLFLVFALSCNSGQKNNETATATEAVPEKDEAVVFKQAGINDLSAADNMQDIICQCWDNKEDAADLAANNFVGDLEIVYRGFCFFKDGSMYKNQRSHLQAGNWQLLDKQKPYVISIKYKNGTSESYKLASLKPKAMSLALTGNEGNWLVEYEGEGFSHKIMDEDPFYKSNNEWRIKPPATETDARLRKRIVEMLHFWVLYYDHNINADLKVVNFTGLPTPYRWYAGGIYLKKEKELLQNWFDCFYNREQAIKAYKMAGDLLDVKYEWPKNESNWLKKNVYVLRQMEKQAAKVQ
ncbi:MAG: hypothetical protein WAT19_07240 [Ferruginibacter sp.]